MKRLFLALLSIGWFLVVFYFWGARPPLMTVVAKSDTAALLLVGFDRTGNVLLARSPAPVRGARNRRRTSHGPLTLHDPKTGRQLKTLMAGDDAIQQMRIGDGIILTSVPGAVRVRAFGQDAPLMETGADAVRGEELLSPNGSRLLVQSGMTVAIHDVRTGQQLWSRPGSKRADWAGETAVALVEADNPGTTSIAAVESGEVLVTTRVGFPEPHEGERSPDGRYVWWAGSQSSDASPGLYDLTTGQRLWGLEQPSVSQFTVVQSRYFFFNDDSSELQVLYATSGDQFATARWNLRDGEPIQAAPEDAALLVNEFRGARRLSSDGRWLCSEISKPLLSGPQGSKWIRRLVFQGARRWPSLRKLFTLLYDSRPHIRITDLKRGRVAAEAERLSTDVTVEPDDSGFLFHGGLVVTRIDLPPRLDYWWLVKFGVLPPAFVLGAWELWRWRQRKAAALRATPAVQAS